jgi:RNA polymerase sigma-70 factor (ECF subfamily)
MPPQRGTLPRVTEKNVVTPGPAYRYDRVDPATERALVARLRRGDTAAFDRIFNELRARVFAFLARLSGRRDLAEELLQETFVRLATRAPGLAEDTRLLPWLYTVARHLHIDHVRLAQLDAARLERLSLAPAAPPPTPFEEAAASQIQARLEAALAALPGAQREALLLVSVERLEPAEAAAVLGVTPETLRQRLARARAMLKDALAEPAPTPARRAQGGSR